MALIRGGPCPAVDLDLSESSLDAYIPSYPGSLRSLSYASSQESITLHYNEPSLSEQSENIKPGDNLLKQATDYLHEEDEFLYAAEIGDYMKLGELISKGADVQHLDQLGRNALHLAVCANSERSIVLLLDAGVNTNVKDNVGMTPLSLCLMRSPSMKIANLLFDHGARLLPRTNPMDTGLFLQFVMMCTPTKEEEMLLQLLLSKGAKVNDPSAPGGRQALHFAAMSDNCDLIHVLIRLGGNIYERNTRGETPKEFALAFRCWEAYELLEELELEYSENSFSEVDERDTDR